MPAKKKAQGDSSDLLGAEMLTGRNVDAVVDHVLSRIRTGEYAQGEPLIAREIARRVGVSVAPVREALHRLWGEGVVEFHSNRSARVRRLSREDVLHASEVWEVNAGLLARLAAERIKIHDNLERLRVVSAEIVNPRKRPDRTSYFHALMKCQNVLVDIGGNPYVQAVKKRLHTEFWTQASVLHIPEEIWPEYVDSYARVIAAILAGAPSEAENEYRRHIRLATTLLRRHLPPDLHLQPRRLHPVAARSGRTSAKRAQAAHRTLR